LSSHALQRRENGRLVLAIAVLSLAALAFFVLRDQPEASHAAPAVATTARKMALSIHSQPTGASVWIDGVYHGRTPLRTVLHAAAHQGVMVELERSAYAPLRRRLIWKDGANIASAEFLLEPLTH
jgi:Tfp pilus assembly protein PilV